MHPVPPRGYVVDGQTTVEFIEPKIRRTNPGLEVVIVPMTRCRPHFDDDAVPELVAAEPPSGLLFDPFERFQRTKRHVDVSAPAKDPTGRVRLPLVKVFREKSVDMRMLFPRRDIVQYD